jgi:hypothetical protein
MKEIYRSKHDIECGQIKKIDVPGLNILIGVRAQTTPEIHGGIIVVHPVCISSSDGFKKCRHKDN